MLTLSMLFLHYRIHSFTDTRYHPILRPQSAQTINIWPNKTREPDSTYRQATCCFVFSQFWGLQTNRDNNKWCWTFQCAAFVAQSNNLFYYLESFFFIIFSPTLVGGSGLNKQANCSKQCCLLLMSSKMLGTRLQTSRCMVDYYIHVSVTCYIPM